MKRKIHQRIKMNSFVLSMRSHLQVYSLLYANKAYHCGTPSKKTSIQFRCKCFMSLSCGYRRWHCSPLIVCMLYVLHTHSYRQYRRCQYSRFEVRIYFVENRTVILNITYMYMYCTVIQFTHMTSYCRIYQMNDETSDDNDDDTNINYEHIQVSINTQSIASQQTQMWILI